MRRIGRRGSSGVQTPVCGGRTSRRPGNFVDTFVTFIVTALGVFLGNAIVLRVRGAGAVGQRTTVMESGVTANVR
jgi:hypothetical protein